MSARLLLTMPVYPFPSLPQQEGATDVMGQRFTRGNGLFTMVSHTHPLALHLLAQNLSTPSVVLEYPRWRHFRQEVARGYEVIGISAYPFHLDTVLDMCRHIRAVSPATRILVGSYAAQALLALGGLEKYGDLIDDLVAEEGVTYLRRLFGEDTGEPITQKFFPKNGAGLRYFGRNPKGNTVVLFSGLGCPGSCDFCSTAAMYKRKRVELLSPAGVVDHVRHYLERSPGSISQFYLVDEDYFRFPGYLLELRRLLAETPKIAGQADFVVFGSVDHIAAFARQHGWEAIAEAGIGVIFIGVESRTAGGNGYDKRHRADAREVFAGLHRVGIRTIGAWIAGFPFQTRTTLREDLGYFIDCCPTYQQLAIFSPFPGTPLHDKQSAAGQLAGCTFADYHFWNPVAGHPEFSNQELLDLTEEGYRLGYETWGACLLRNLDVHLNGLEHCRSSGSELLLRHAVHVHRKNALKIRTQLRTMSRYAPNEAVKERIDSLQRRSVSLLGLPGALEESVSRFSVLAAAWHHWSGRLIGWRPKVEGFRRYLYDRQDASGHEAPYVIDRRSFAPLVTVQRAIAAACRRLLPRAVPSVADGEGEA